MKEATIGLGINSDKIQLIYFGIDTKKFHPDKKNNDFKLRLGYENRPMIISLRNFEPIYDIESLIQAVPLVTKQFPWAIFLIVGRGSEEKKLKNLTNKLNINNNIRFLGFIANDELPLYLVSADVYVSTSLSDAGIAASTAEAMACGTTVVITDSGENKKWVKNNENGVIVPIKNPEQLAQKIIELLKDKQKRNFLGLNGRKIIVQRNDYYGEMNKMEKLYKELIFKNK